MNDEIYYCHQEDGMYLLRFYSSGVVFGVTVRARIEDMDKILTWFNLESYSSDLSKGIVRSDGRSISFELTSSSGTVTYRGERKPDNTLKLFVHSLINGYKSEKTYLLYNKSGSQLKSNPQQPAQTPPQNYSTNSTSLGSRFLTFLFICLALTGCFTCATRKRSGCHCWDGTNSSARGSGACSWHGGVMYWEHTYWWDW
jgi:hypothetical protein